MNKLIVCITLFVLLPFICNANAKSNNASIRIVGSSTAYPYIIAVAENFYRDHPENNVIVEPTGTGMGFKLFCAGNQDDSPAIVLASRKIKQSELDMCKKNGIDSVYESTFGYDGIIVASSKENKITNLSRQELFKAMSDSMVRSKTLTSNSYTRWSEINPKLPDYPIIIYGPTASSGTREEINNLIMNHTCKQKPVISQLFKNNKKICSEIRSDRAYVDVGKNENLVLTKIQQQPESIGITGYNYFIQNLEKVKALKIDGVYPSKKNLLNMNYSLSRPLLIYYKKNHSPNKNKAYRSFLKRLFSSFMIGYKGYLQTKGLIPITDKEIKASLIKINENFKQKNQ